MPDLNLADSITRYIADWELLGGPCRERILIVVDGLNYDPLNGFGLTRFLEAISIGVSPKPILTLADRYGVSGTTVTIGTDTYTVRTGFTFDSTITTTNYDQIWLFGFDQNPALLSDTEVGIIAAFMNAGGGLFATGDHLTLGFGLCGDLPRVRHMRDWSSIPMGLELNSATAVNRIDTVVDPGLGAGNPYEFADQSDDIPQRIYPNYSVTDLDAGAGNAWEATVHPLLMLPGAIATRTTAADFTQDIDCLPDHPHESVCSETPTAMLAGQYNIRGQNFVEHQPLVSNSSQRSKAVVVAYAVSGGRSVYNGGWKPPVTPRMFPVISAYDGRLAQPYSGTTRPGRIVCDSTWHHYVNINLDGTQSAGGRTGLGTGSGSSFVPGPQLLKIYAFYRNIVKWIQQASRVWCRWYWDLVALRYNPVLIEELATPQVFGSWPSQVALGRAAAQLLAMQNGPGALDDTIASLLLNDSAAEGLGDLFATRTLRQYDIDPDDMKHGILGGSLVKMAEALPINDRKAATAFLKRGIEKNIQVFAPEVRRLAATALANQFKRAERKIALLRDPRLAKLNKAPN